MRDDRARDAKRAASGVEPTLGGQRFPQSSDILASPIIQCLPSLPLIQRECGECVRQSVQHWRHAAVFFCLRHDGHKQACATEECEEYFSEAKPVERFRECIEDWIAEQPNNGDPWEQVGPPLNV